MNGQSAWKKDRYTTFIVNDLHCAVLIKIACIGAVLFRVQKKGS